MKLKGLRLVILTVILAALIVPTTMVRSRPVYADALDEKFQELQDLLKEIDQYKSQISSQKRTETSVMNEIQKLDKELALAEKELAYIQTKMTYLNGEIDQTREEITQIQERLAAQKACFEARLVSMYKSRNVSYVEVLLESDSISNFLARVRYLRDLTAYDNQLMDTYKAEHRDLEERKAGLEGDLAQMLVLKRDQEDKRVEVVSRSRSREDYLAQVQKERKRLEELLDAMEAESKALEKVIADLQAKNPRPKNENLSMAWPISGGWISDYYGWRNHPILNIPKFHSGVDYAANTGTDIKAMEAGSVLLAGTNGGYGLCVIIDHGGGISTLYGHASKLLVKKGEEVYKGQVIAKVGSTGVSTGPHLHFEVRVNGVTQNPLDWLP